MRTPFRVLPDRPPPAGSFTTALRVDLVVAVGLTVVVVAFGLAMVREPARFGDLTVRNPSEYNIAVEVYTPDDDGRLPIGSVEPYSATTFHELLDRGPNWIVAFRAQGHTVEVEVTRADIRAAANQLDVPAETVERFRALALPASPCTRPDCPSSTPRPRAGD